MSRSSISAKTDFEIMLCSTSILSWNINGKVSDEIPILAQFQNPKVSAANHSKKVALQLRVDKPDFACAVVGVHQVYCLENSQKDFL